MADLIAPRGNEIDLFLVSTLSSPFLVTTTQQYSDVEASARRLERWFAEDGDDYCVVKEFP